MQVSGYGQAIYLWFVSKTEKINFSLLMEKALVAAIRYIAIPRMELVTGTLLVNITALIQKELQLFNVKETF